MTRHRLRGHREYCGCFACFLTDWRSPNAWVCYAAIAYLVGSAICLAWACR